MSETWKSSGGEASSTPLSPPNRKVTRNPIENSIGDSNVSCPFHIVPIQLKNLIPVGMATRNVSSAKNGSSTAPVAYMWCAQTASESAAIDSVAQTSPLYPKTGLREKTGMISEITPKNGSARMYTSGCPKNQNMCCHSTTPPLAGSKTCAPSSRSASRPNPAAVRIGKTISTRMLVTRMFQVKTGIRHIVMPGPRRHTTVVTMLTAPRIVPRPPTATPTIQRFAPTPGE